MPLRPIAMSFSEAFAEGRLLMKYFRDKGIDPGKSFIVFAAMLALQMADDDDNPVAADAKRILDMMVPTFREELRRHYVWIEPTEQDNEPKRH